MDRVQLRTQAASAKLGRAEEQRLLREAAERLFAERGYASTTVDDIVEQAGLSKPALYRHVESKKELYLTLLRCHREELAAAALNNVDPDRNLLEYLDAMVDSWFAHVERHPYAWRMLFRDTTGDPDVQAVLAELSRAQRAADVALLRVGAPDLPEAELELLGEVIRASLAGLALWWLEHPDTPRSDLVSAMSRVARGIITTAR